jgi:hypothetical protein
VKVVDTGKAVLITNNAFDKPALRKYAAVYLLAWSLFNNAVCISEYEKPNGKAAGTS